MINRKKFRGPITRDSLSAYPCPTCGTGTLRTNKDAFHHRETNSSKAEHGDYRWAPDWIEYIFSCLMVCSNSVCQDIISSNGKGSVSFEDLRETFSPIYFYPNLKFFNIPTGTPEDVVDEVNRSFALFFADPSSAASHIRISLEYLLNSLKIRRYTNTRKGRTYLPLHNRIDLLPKRYDHVKELFFAVKWLGNAGSHSNKEVGRNDVFDCYELMSELLFEVISNRSEKTKALAKQINKRKGPK